jgi:hypothetical protein
MSDLQDLHRQVSRALFSFVPPKAGDMIARNPKNHADQWFVEAKYFADNFEPLSKQQAKCASSS